MSAFTRLDSQICCLQFIDGKDSLLAPRANKRFLMCITCRLQNGFVFLYSGCPANIPDNGEESRKKSRPKIIFGDGLLYSIIRIINYLSTDKGFT
jgi:hypothetical protein